MSSPLNEQQLDSLLDTLEHGLESGVVMVRTQLPSGRYAKAFRYWGPDTDACIGLAHQAASFISKDTEPDWDEDEDAEETDEETEDENPLPDFPQLGMYL